MPGQILTLGSAPIALGDQLTIARGQLLQFSAANLAPKVLLPYEIHSIRMCAYPSIESAPAGIGSTTSLRGFLKWQFILGRLPLTDGFIPMWNLCPVRQLITENGGYFTWRFKRPLLVPPGGRIDAKVQLQLTTPNAGVSPITVAVSYSGFLRGDLTTFPNNIDVPYASAWDTTAAGQTGLANDGLSLRNPLVRNVDVEMLVCRVQSDSTGLDGDDSATFQLFDPWGRAVHRSGSIQIHALFPPPSRSFPYDGVIPASNGRFQVRLDAAPSATYRPMFSYLGSRREAIL